MKQTSRWVRATCSTPVVVAVAAVVVARGEDYRHHQ